MRKTLIALLYLVTTIGFAQNQPYASYWYVEDLLRWSPETDKHAAFNISYTPLAKRFTDSTTQIRKELSNDPKIISLIPTHSTSNHPSQGFSTIKQYAFPFWQYIDYFVQWGGSAVEGIILSPVPTWTDAAHKNGVKSIGTVFFPPIVYGGKKEWVMAFLQQKEDGSFPVADKLIEVAKHYHFDGWFINQETKGLDESYAEKMVSFIEYYQDKSGEAIELVWYDAMITDGRVIWQRELNHHNQIFFQKNNKKMADLMFIDFKYQETQLEDSHDVALQLKRSPWDLYAGIDVQQRGYKSYAKWDALLKDEKPYTTSIGLYWPSATFDLSKTKEPEEVYSNEQKFWNGGETFTTPYGDMTWKGFTNYFPASGIVKELPFITNFNYGLGRFYNEKGQTISKNEWHNLSIQDILPTWQWQTDTTQVKPSFYFKESYNGGSCLKLESKTGATIPLYKTKIDLNTSVNISIVAKGDSQVKTYCYVLLSNGKTKKVGLHINKTWKTSSFAIKSQKNTTIVSLGFETQGKGNVLIGEILMRNRKEPSLPKSKFSVEAFPNNKTTELYVHLKPANNKAVYHNIYKITNKGEKIWLGKTASKDYYIKDVPVENEYINLVVQPISKSGKLGKPSRQKIRL
ncbi:endo-beta-N-acetylglucosaminidase [Flavivirga eckloniae]|uniref:Cytosolic endo-beta-N-acetylglucosaminidase TIM barrel domain-containing protein n=1 Tax=Flavivirga eckloniae TaxID=1803846 RepID=A0A2K9PSP6_9FLAO|nr:hypothetical protein [Flavivirga eckloniae]AUP80084.1 hypothetical protein C1H87_15765 [Flavivirga eckloniae]